MKYSFEVTIDELCKFEESFSIRRGDHEEHYWKFGENTIYGVCIGYKLAHFKNIDRILLEIEIERLWD